MWDRIAASFDRTRTRPWPHVEEFVRSLPPDSLVLDLVGGNGRHERCIVEAGHRALWVDWSRELARIARRRNLAAQFIVADARRLPVADGSVDAAIYVAGLHGIPEPEGRAASLRELRRVLRPGGRAQITVWNRDAARFQKEGRPGKPVDVVVPWKAGGHDEARTYHLYTEEELQLAIASVGLRVALQSVSPAIPGDNLVVEAYEPSVGN